MKYNHHHYDDYDNGNNQKKNYENRKVAKQEKNR